MNSSTNNAIISNEQLMLGRSKPVSVHGLMKDGSEFPMELSISAMPIDGQQLFIGMVRDISEKNEMEKQLQHAQKILRFT